MSDFTEPDVIKDDAAATSERIRVRRAERRMKMTWRAAVLLAALAAMALPVGAGAQSSDKTLRFIPQADLRVLDPIWTTAYITRNHGYMVYDTLFALDKDLTPQPQMVDKFIVSDDKLKYTFTLRDGLKWHDGQPVTSADCVASIRRWGKRDPLGQKLTDAVSDYQVIDDKTFTLTLKEPFPLMLDGLAKPSNNTPFMMPERLAKTDAFRQVTDATGSGPFKFVKNEWVPGHKAVYVKNTDYVPRQEPPSFAAGGKVVKVDRVEWLYIPDPTTASAALNVGEADWYEAPPQDLLPIFTSNEAVIVANIDPLGNQGALRFNHLQPPFDNVKMRQAVLHLVDQKEYMTAVANDAKYWKVCPSVFPCGSPMASNAGAEGLFQQSDFVKAKQLIKEAGYKGEKIIILTATDQPHIHNQALLTTELLKWVGLNVQLDASDWGTLITRRASKEPIEKGGWSIFHTWFNAPDMLNPAINTVLRADGDAAWFGWPKDDKLEELRAAWLRASDLEMQKKIAAETQTEAFQSVPYVPTGQFQLPTAYRRNLEGLIVSPVIFFWNIEKK
jgi:peptide/nickel transport system substrate-binding protein